MLPYYQDWQSIYLSLRTARRLEATTEEFTHIGDAYQDCLKAADLLGNSLNNWLKSNEFRPVKERLLENLSKSDEVRIILQVDDILMRLPWHLWDFFERYPKAELALGTQNYAPVDKLSPTTGKVRILAILGNSYGIDVDKDRALLEQLPNAEVQFLTEPQRREINDQLWEQPWDIFFFAGHSRTDAETGRISINQTDSLTIDELRHGLRKAIAQGLQLAIFNSCDGLGLAQQLANLQIPQVIVMREPVPDKVAQEFLKYFIRAFSQGESFYLAVRDARERLQGLEDEFPCASWLPVIFQHPAVIPPNWQALGGICTQLQLQPIPVCPYQGLSAFREEHAPVFFGREKFTQPLIDAVRQKALVPVVGPSGSGKSSVVFAGLISQLRDEGNWLIDSFRPKNRPFNELATALVRLLEPKLGETRQLVEAGELAVALRQGTVTLRSVIDRLLQKNPGFRVLLVGDQFEELYTLCRDKEERDRFIDELLSAVASVSFDRTPNFSFVFTLRADFYGYVLSYRPFRDALEKFTPQLLGPMNAQELQAAIEKPAEQFGVQLESGLTGRILEDISSEPGNLPLMEFAMTRLWSLQRDRQLTHNAYGEIGGVQKALANHAEAVFAFLSETQQQQAQRIFLQLVRPGEGTEDTRRLANRAEVGEDNWDLIGYLAGESARLVVTGRNETTGEETVEVVHESLIREWQRLREWMESDRTFRTWQERLRSAMRQWESSSNDEWALLRGVLLAEAEDWQQQRLEYLSPSERKFIEKSLELRDREKAEKEARELEKLEIQITLDAEREANQILTEANRKAKRRIRTGSLVLSVSLIAATMAGILAGVANQKLQSLKQVETTLQATLGRLGIERRRIAYYTLGNYAKEIDYLQKSLEVARKIKDHRGEGYALGNLGLAYYALGDYSKAIEYHQKHLEISREIQDIQSEGLALGNLGNVYQALGDYPKVIKYHQKHLEISRKTTDRFEEGDALGNLGIAYYALGDYVKAIEYHQQHLNISREIQDIQGQGQALGNLGNVYQALGDYVKAIKYQQEYLKISQEIQDVQGKGEALVNLGNAYFALGNQAKAIEYAQQSLAIAREIKDRPLEGIALDSLGNALFKSGNLLEAQKQLEDGIKVWESLRVGLGDNYKVSILGRQANTYRTLQKVLIAQKKTDVALEIAERGRARAFVELLASRISSNPEEKLSAPPNIEEIKQIAKEQNATLVEYSIIYDNIKVQGKGKGQERASELYIWVIQPTGNVTFRQVDLKPLWQQQNTSLKDLVAKNLVDINQSAIVGVRTNQLTLKKGDRVKLKNDFSQDPAWIVVTVNNDTLTLRQPSHPQEQTSNHPITDVVEKVSQSSANAKHQKLQQLYELLIKPIAEELPKKPDAHIIFIPQQELFAVPFHALQDSQGKYLIEKHTILTAPSIQVLQLTHQQRQRVPGSTKDVLLVGNPIMPKVAIKPGETPQQLPQLPGTEIEVKAIATLFQAKPIIGKDATKLAILPILPKARIIHFATHGLLDDIQGLGSAIVLAPSGKDNGLLTAEEIFDLKLNAELVVLSACSTGVGKITDDGVIGLSRSLISAGVPSVIVSLWSIPDAPTASLMTEFYQQLQKGDDKASALRQAMLSTMEKHPDPKNWAAFTLIGESN